MLYCDFSSEKIFVWQKIIENKDLEKNLPKLLLEQSKNKTEIFVLNGPWSFNGLRIGILCINLLNQLENQKYNLFEISKPELILKLFEDKKIGRKWLIYIGQRNNFWLVDWQKKTLEKVSKSQINFSDLDWIEDMNLVENENLEKINFFEYLKKLDKKNFESKKFLETNYMIQPNIG